MNSLDGMPHRAVPQERRQADLRMLREMVGRKDRQHAPRRRNLLVVLPIVGLGVSATTAAAFAFLPSEHASVHDSVRCYGRVSADTRGGYPGTDVGIASAMGMPPSDVAATAVSSCAAVWRAGLLTAAGASRPNHPGNEFAAPAAVPQLTACVLSSGQAAVYPGRQSICEQLGIHPLAP